MKPTEMCNTASKMLHLAVYVACIGERSLISSFKIINQATVYRTATLKSHVGKNNCYKGDCQITHIGKMPVV